MSNKPIQDERRRFNRVELQAQVALADAETGEDIAWGRSLNLSMTGLYMRSRNQPKVGTRCAVTVDWSFLPGAPVIFAIGMVVRAEDGHVAVELVEMPTESYENLWRLVAENDANPDKLLDDLRDDLALSFRPI